jgi:KDO2-lipid IV(A) lauroyltransferase
MKIGPGERIEIEGLEHIDAVLAKPKPLIFFSAHCGNWELFGPAAAWRGIPLNLVYRAPNNPYLDWLFTERGNIGADMIPKGTAGARKTLQVLMQGKALGLLVDQKMNDGIAVPFFGREAMTAPALAQFALKFKCPVVPGHVVRLKGARFRLIIEPPLPIPDSGDRHADILAIMTTVNRMIENWVRAHPEQWLWVHKRWG